MYSMSTDWPVWAGVLCVGAIVIELVRLNIIFVSALKQEAQMSGSSAQGAGQEMGSLPIITVIMPAKDEEIHIEQSARSVLASDYPQIELLLVNDRSQDRTPEIMARLAAEDSRVKIISISELPPGWTGKTHAMFHAARQASGEIFLFTDADAVLKQDTLPRALHYFITNELDMLSLLPGFTRRGFIEDAVYAHMALGIAYFYPLAEVNDKGKPAGLASGCFIMMKAKTYAEIGTWERFRKELTEDVALSKAVKAGGGKLSVLRAGDMVCTRPFETISDVCLFWKRTFYGGLEKSVPKLLHLTANYLVLSLLSALFVGSGVIWLNGGATLPVTVLFGASTLAMTAMIIPLVIFIRQERGHWPYGLTVPVGTLIGAWVTLTTALTIIAHDGIRWRGSVYK
jgi:cellulose synthase/poly-beta-1,6-N-acetylglucosamine synthase-like glycosyltransferase